jgi:pimeloyl-ACP methyl ester carboxylesterase
VTKEFTMRELSWNHQSGGVDPGGATRSGPKKRKLDRTHRTVAAILWCTIVVLLAIALPITNKPLAAGSPQMLAGDSFLAARSAPGGTIYVDGCAPGPGEYGTLTAAVAAASSGDTIVMQGGSYPEKDSVSFSENLDIHKALTLTASDGAALVGEYYVGQKDDLMPTGSGGSTSARVYYPSNAPGGPVIACNGGPFPVVVYAHGLRNPGQSQLCSWCEDDLRTDNTQDYKQAEGILKRLALSGAVAISFNWHGLTSEADAIAGYVIDAITYLGNEFGDDVDLDRVGLIGHSTGGQAVTSAAQELRQQENPPAVFVGLIAPVFSTGQPSGPVLVIHGTRDHACQVGTDPLGVYCVANAPKYLVVLTGANHFGYTDGICLNPSQPRTGRCPNDPWGLLPEADGWDNSSLVGGVEEQAAHARQQRAAGNYLHAFFSHYLGLPGKAGALSYLRQKTGEQCGHPDDAQQCNTREVDVYMWWPYHPADKPCSGVRIELRDSTGVIDTLPPVDQRVNSGQWNHLGTYDFTEYAGVSIVNIDSSGGCSVVADAVKFVTSYGSPPSPKEFIVDNGDRPWTASAGTWTASTECGDCYGQNYLLSSDPIAVYGFQPDFSMEIDTSDCEPQRLFDDLEDLNVEVSVCSCE